MLSQRQHTVVVGLDYLTTFASWRAFQSWLGEDNHVECSKANDCNALCAVERQGTYTTSLTST